MPPSPPGKGGNPDFAFYCNPHAAVKDFFSDLRETWERLVEEILFNGGVGRFQRDVATQSLTGVRVEDEDYRRVFFSMKRVSGYSGHEKTIGARTALPRHDEIAKDPAEIRAFAKELKEKRKA
jgi:hypothetical protein